MSFNEEKIHNVESICATTQVEQDHALLLKKLSQVFPEYEFNHVLTRGGWHRAGGIVTSKHERIAYNLEDWVVTGCANGLDEFIPANLDQDYLVTSLQGKTHYFVAIKGQRAEQFIQLEIEELQEQTSHHLLNEDALPEDIDDLLDLDDVAAVEAVPLGAPVYSFRRLIDIESVMREMSEHILDKSSKYLSVQRFMSDWDKCGSKEKGHFSKYWILGLQEYTDAYGEPIIIARPVSTFSDEIDFDGLSATANGSKRALAIRKFDEHIGYPMAWYFYMLSHREVPHSLAESIHEDLLGEYDYLPEHHRGVLEDWRMSPYGL